MFFKAKTQNNNGFRVRFGWVVTLHLLVNGLFIFYPLRLLFCEYMNAISETQMFPSYLDPMTINLDINLITED